MKRLFLCWLVACVCVGCSSTKPSVRVGVDPTWYPLELDGKQANVFAFVDELLQEMTKQGGARYQRVSFSWDDLLHNLEEGNCEVVVSSMTPHNFNRNKYRFSEIFLQTGPVLIVSKDSRIRSLADVKNASIGVEPDSPAAQRASRLPGVIPIGYNSIPAALDMVIAGGYQGALVDVILALSYVKDLYHDNLKIVGKPLFDQGLRFVSEKEGDLIHMMNEDVARLRSDGTYRKLLKKWNVGE